MSEEAFGGSVSFVCLQRAPFAFAFFTGSSGPTGAMKCGGVLIIHPA